MKHAGGRFLGGQHRDLRPDVGAAHGLRGATSFPARRLNPIAQRYLALYPVPTSPGLSNNYTGVRERTQDSRTADVRIDQILNGNNRLFARYSFNGVDTFTPPVFPIVDGIEGGGGGSFPGANDSTAHGIGVRATSACSAHPWSESSAPPT